LSIGFHAPYYWITNSVTTTLDNRTANVGLNPATGDCCIPGGTPMQIDDVQQLIMDEYGFERIDRWRRDGIGDIELGGKYRFFLRRDSAFAATGGLRIPTGYEDDADQLDDVAWSYGNYALLLRLHYDYLLSNLWNDDGSTLDPLAPTPGDTVVNLTFRYDYMLPDDKTMRIGDTPEQVLTGNRERVSRKLGDLVNIELAATYHATDALALAAAYTYGFKAKDDIDGSMGFNYASLEADTDSSEQIIIVELTYSTLAAYHRQQRSTPMEFTVAYRDRFKGKGPRSGQANPKLDTRWFVVGMTVLF